jgi:hypothetical protein
VSLADLKNAAKKATVSEQIAQGERTEMICKLIDLQTILGRSLVIDLNATTESKFR